MSEIDPLEDDDPELVIKEMRTLLERKTLKEPPIRKIKKQTYSAASGNTGLALVHSLRIGLRQLGGLEPPDETIPVFWSKRKPRTRKKKPRSKKVLAKKKRKPKGKVIRPAADKIIRPKKIRPKRRPTRSIQVPKPKRRTLKPRKQVKRLKPKKPTRKTKARRKLSGKEKLARLLMKARRKK